MHPPSFEAYAALPVPHQNFLLLSSISKIGSKSSEINPQLLCEYVACHITITLSHNPIFFMQYFNIFSHSFAVSRPLRSECLVISVKSRLAIELYCDGDFFRDFVK